MPGKPEKHAGRDDSEEESPAGSRKQIKSFRRGIAFGRFGHQKPCPQEALYKASKPKVFGRRSGRSALLL